MKINGVTCSSALLLIAVTASPQQPTGQTSSANTNRTRVVLLGTGQPAPDPDRSGPATAIVIDGSAYLVDFGPGVVRRAKQAVLERHVAALDPGNLKVAFATHLHSDHTTGYPDLILTGWTAGRRIPHEVYGPTGLQFMTEHILQACRLDIETRTNPEGNQRGIAEGWKVNAHEIRDHLQILLTSIRPRSIFEQHQTRNRFEPAVVKLNNLEGLQASNPGTTLPATSVSRKCRPWNL